MSQGPKKPMITARELKKTFVSGDMRVDVLKGINLTVCEGEFISIVGPSGSGKSTLVGLLAGLDNPTSGQILLGGIEISNMSESRLAKIRGQLIGYIFQSFNLISTLTALENIELPLILNGNATGSRNRAKEVLSAVGLEDRMGHFPGQLSGGQQQRVAIARALACNPPIIIADEPTGNLDTSTGTQVMGLLQNAVRQMGKAVILVTHDREHAAKADRIFQIKNGILAEGETGIASS